jgi:hypothetical protein
LTASPGRVVGEAVTRLFIVGERRIIHSPPIRPTGYLLMIYTKARQENLTAKEKKIVRKLAAILKS